MFGPKFSSLFKSRWMALLWAAIILWMAVDYVGFGSSDDAADQPASPQDVATVQQWLDSK